MAAAPATTPPMASGSSVPDSAEAEQERSLAALMTCKRFNPHTFEREVEDHSVMEVEEPVVVDDVIAGIVLIKGIISRALFDTGASHSFISRSFTSTHGIESTVSEDPWWVDALEHMFSVKESEGRVRERRARVSCPSALLDRSSCCPPSAAGRKQIRLRPLMAIVCASQFVSKCLHAKYGTATDSKSRTFQNKKIADFKNQLAAHHGLRSQNFVDLLQMRTNVKAKSKQAKKGSASAGRRPCAVVICGKGINIVFVGAEMAPWSKTGALVMFLEDSRQPWR
uniref:Uncharacterized protein n=1 Tax=Ananas comosus var. bracteatus TaxID=296719 RepID=A0A6V7PGV9_ANACO|nr:unnamed protein product [Ananas comosus var. bracteatus]